jgi:hypothetical protein
LNRPAVYALASIFSLFAVLPIAPFAHKMHRLFTTTIAVIFLITVIYTLSAFPFTETSPMKIYFAQNIELRNGTLTPPKTTLSGVQPHLQKQIVSDMPSAWTAPVNCSADDLGRGPGLTSCTWTSNLLPSPGRGRPSALPLTAPSLHVKPTEWIKWNVTRTNSTAVRISLSGTNSRACRVYFDSRPITSYSVAGGPGAGGLRRGWEMPEAGIKEVRLWSRSWNRAFVVDAAWALEGGNTEGVSGRVACLWAEHESGAAGGRHIAGGRIPAYEETLANFPRWALPTKRQEGLVEVWERFEV